MMDFCPLIVIFRNTDYMKYLFILFIALAASLSLSAQEKKAFDTLPDPNRKMHVAEAACGQCKFGLPGKSCDLAVRINGKAYFVEGTSIDEHGDAHAEDGFCNAIRKAKVQGEIVQGKFVVTYFQLLPTKKKG